MIFYLNGVNSVGKSLSIKDLENVVIGATFLGTGGGGSPENGLQLVKEISKVTSSISLVSPDEIGDNEYVSMIAGMGAPKVLKEKGFGPEALHAFLGLEKVYSMIGVKFRYIMPGETGGFNTITPIYVAAMKGLKVVDADGTGGRAVPELGTSLYNLYGVGLSPFAVADKAGNTVVGWLADPLDGATAENIARYITVAFGMISGLGTWVATGWQLKNFLEPHVIERSLSIGKTIRKSREEGLDVVKEVLKITEGYLLFKGVVKKVAIRTEAGFDFGEVTLEGVDEFSGKTFVINSKNENMIAWKAPNEPAAMVPDSICYLGLNGEVYTNADVVEGLKLAIIGLKASEKWRKHPKAFEVWKPILEKIGYKGTYIPVEKLV